MKNNLFWIGLAPAVFIVVVVLVSVVSTNDTANQNGSDAEQLDAADLMQSENNQGGDNMLKGTKLADFEPLDQEASELEKNDLKTGEGATVKKGDTITAHYTGAYASTGEIFESSHDAGPFTAVLITPAESADGRGLIDGWVEGIPGMKVGGTRRLIIPGKLAYGEAPEGYTPGSTQQPLGTLVFDIEIIEIAE